MHALSRRCCYLEGALHLYAVRSAYSGLWGIYAPFPAFIRGRRHSQVHRFSENSVIHKLIFRLLTWKWIQFAVVAQRPDRRKITMAMMARTTFPRPTNMLGLECRLHSKAGSLEVYKLDLEERSMNSKNARQCIVKSGNRVDAPHIPEKTILLVGQSGSGKSTLIDAMLNYIVGVRMEDQHRFKLIDLTDREQEHAKNKVDSQTDMITCYTIPWLHGTDIPFTVNLVDTPGTLSTEGVGKDKQQRENIRSFFSNECVSFLDALCFIVKSSEIRLNDTQRAIFHDMQEAFGKDVQNNTFVFTTFCDNMEPEALKTLKAARVPFKHWYRVNNVALFTAIPRGSEMDPLLKCFWELTDGSMRDFFQNDLRCMPGCSIHITKKVCKNRWKMEELLQELAHAVGEDAKITEPHHRLLDELKGVQFSEDYLNMVIHIPDVYCPRKVPIARGDGKYATNCKKCPATCHKRCLAFLDVLARRCEMMDGSRQCKSCQHPASDHRSSRRHYVNEKTTVTKTIQSLMTEYDVKGENPKALMDAVETKIRECYKRQMGRVRNICPIADELNTIALKSIETNELDYIRSAIAYELADKKEGWNDRLRGLQRLQEKYERQSDGASTTS